MFPNNDKLFVGSILIFRNFRAKFVRTIPRVVFVFEKHFLTLSCLPVWAATYQFSESVSLILCMKSVKCCKTYMLYVVYQYNIISCVLSKKQDRNKINNLSDSSLFTFHLVSSFALGCTKMFFKPFSPTTSRSSENILLKRIDELLQPKEKMSKSISSDYIRRNFYYPQR